MNKLRLLRPRFFCAALCLSIFSVSFVAHAEFSAAVIQSVESTLLEGPIHHGWVVHIQRIVDANLTGFDVDLKKDDGNPYTVWKTYNSNLSPYDYADMNIPYRNGILALESNQKYCIRVRAIYGPTTTAWAQKCGLLTPPLASAPGDIDGDGLSNNQEYNLGTDPRNPDSDADGLNDQVEVTENSDPNVAQLASLVFRGLSSAGDIHYLDFGLGNAYGNLPSQNQLLQIQNVGDAPVLFNQIKVIASIGQEDVFHVLSPSQPLGFLPPHNTLYLPVTFIPKNNDQATAKLSITYTPDRETEVIELRGKGTGFPDCQVSTEAIVFPEVDARDQQVLVQYLTLANESTDSGTSWGVTLESPSNEIGLGLPDIILPSEKNIRVPVLYRHSVAGNHDGKIKIRSFQCGIKEVDVKASSH